MCAPHPYLSMTQHGPAQNNINQSKEPDGCFPFPASDSTDTLPHTRSGCRIKMQVTLVPPIGIQTLLAANNGKPADVPNATTNTTTARRPPAGGRLTKVTAIPTYPTLPLKTTQSSESGSLESDAILLDRASAAPAPLASKQLGFSLGNLNVTLGGEAEKEGAVFFPAPRGISRMQSQKSSEHLGMSRKSSRDSSSVKNPQMLSGSSTNGLNYIAIGRAGTYSAAPPSSSADPNGMFEPPSPGTADTHSTLELHQHEQQPQDHHVVPARFGDRAKSSANLHAVSFPPALPTAQPAGGGGSGVSFHPMLLRRQGSAVVESPAGAAAASPPGVFTQRAKSSGNLSMRAVSFPPEVTEPTPTAIHGSPPRPLPPKRAPSSSSFRALKYGSISALKSASNISTATSNAQQPTPTSSSSSNETLRPAAPLSINTATRIGKGSSLLASTRDLSSAQLDQPAAPQEQQQQREGTSEKKESTHPSSDRKRRTASDYGLKFPTERTASSQSFLLPIIAPTAGTRVVPAPTKPSTTTSTTSMDDEGDQPEQNRLPVEEEDTANHNDRDKVFANAEPDMPDGVSTRGSRTPTSGWASSSRPASRDASRDARPRSNSMKWAGDGGAAKRTGKPIWKPGGMDDAARAEFVKNKAKSRALMEQLGKRKVRKPVAEDEKEISEEEGTLEISESSGTELQQLRTVPDDAKPKAQRKAVKFSAGARPGSAHEDDADSARLPALPITAVLMYDPPLMRSALRLAKPPKSRRRSGDVSSEEQLDKPEEAKVPENMAHSLRAEFLKDFTLLSSHDTTQRDIDMQHLLRDVDAIGFSRPGWSNTPAMHALGVSDIRRMCRGLYTYLQSEHLDTRHGLMGDGLGTRVVQSVGSGGPTAEFVKDMREVMGRLERNKYLYAKAMIGHMYRISTLPCPHDTLTHLSAAFGPILFPQKYVRPEPDTPLSPLIDLHDQRPIPGFRRFNPNPSATPSPGLYSPFAAFFTPPIPTAAVDPFDVDPVLDPTGFACLVDKDGEGAPPCVAPLGPQASAVRLLCENYEAIFGGGREEG
ncbi:hypothetical protein DFJ77DRAFT_270922 [Powellomyces hirtus]|nr:hypothetical protein DFJ77DRAFT_270922 [Powellomyces hirtus]